jgi:hypothetical protein
MNLGNSALQEGIMLRKMGIVNLAALLTIASGILVGCQPATPTPPPPQVDISVSPGNQIGVGEEASIITSSNDEITSYDWTPSKGTLNSKTLPSVIYTAPQEPGQDIVTLVVKGPTGTTTKSINLTIIGRTPTLTPLSLPTVPPVASVQVVPETKASSSMECNGKSSQEYITQSWSAFDGKNYQKLLACTQGAIDGWTTEADDQQAKRLRLNICTTTPDPNDSAAKTAYSGEYWALNDIGTAWFLRGEAFSGLQDWKNAREAYKKVIDLYSCAYAWGGNSNPIFWRVQTAANKSLNAIPTPGN